MVSLSTHVSQLHMVGPIYADRLKKIGIETIEDLLYHIPFRYNDFSNIVQISHLEVGSTVTVVAEIKSIKNIYTRRRISIQKAVVSDSTGTLPVVWYNQTYLTTVLPPGTKVALAGEITGTFSNVRIESPEFEIFNTSKLIHSARFVPIYPETAKVSSKWIRARIDALLTKFSLPIPEFLPGEIRSRHQLISEPEVINKIHFPKNENDISVAKRKLAFNELFLLELQAYTRRASWERKTVTNRLSVNDFREDIEYFISRLPFTLTSDQLRALHEIYDDLERAIPMNRLLEGDVGAGKTVVAAVAIYLIFLNGFTSLLMAPTEVLALQHYETISQLLTPYGVKVGLQTSKNKLQNQIDYHTLVGTHALIVNKERNSDVALVIIDEQQRFGVTQRAQLREKGTNPHLLTMTATPIPRTIALTLYSDLDISVINELPKGRKKIKTWVVPNQKRDAAYNWIRKQVTSTLPRQQVFVVCPFIEISETLTSVRAAKAEYDRLKRDVFPDLRSGLLHGRLAVKERNETLRAFSDGELDILIATPIIEVGIDIENASIILIEAAERFGLSQLHQLRGRVGRRSQQSYCLLFTESTSTESLKRLKILETEYSGPKLAQYDMKMRGIGDLFGTKQHGQIALKYADLSDTTLIHETKDAVRHLLALDKSLKSFPLLRDKLRSYTIKDIAPD